jgi:hypothetical protein
MISSRMCRRNCARPGRAPRLRPRFPDEHHRQRCNALFDYFLIADGGQELVTKDGKLHFDDPKVREASLRALAYPTTAYKEGYVPPGAINWNEADDNNAFHAKHAEIRRAPRLRAPRIGSD